MFTPLMRSTAIELERNNGTKRETIKIKCPETRQLFGQRNQILHERTRLLYYPFTEATGPTTRLSPPPFRFSINSGVYPCCYTTSRRRPSRRGFLNRRILSRLTQE
ncbi:hypothetical protein L2E82_01271 [Cichorium intybus]|uniref:Uncharacterized protein n=1 Tax=Cichorium intybus TaxID=13427 RepID=A0ACB9GZ87_CICIN|nr:hypothetical protein L2E82_01271 [Cichorium intybus]